MRTYLSYSSKKIVCVHGAIQNLIFNAYLNVSNRYYDPNKLKIRQKIQSCSFSRLISLSIKDSEEAKSILLSNLIN